MNLFNFFLRPGVVALGWIATVLSCLSGFYFYQQGKAARELSFYVVPAAAQIVKAGQSSNLAVTFKGQPVTTDISAIQIAVWNAGKLPIRPINVLEEISLTAGEKTQILEATLRANTRGLTRATLDTSELSKGRVGVSWNILEQDDGFSLQLILSGSPDTKVGVEGVIEGQSQIVRVQNVRKASPLRTVINIFGIIVVLTIIGLGWQLTAQNVAKGMKRSTFTKVTDVLVPLLCLAGIIYANRESLSTSSNPPPILIRSGP